MSEKNEKMKLLGKEYLDNMKKKNKASGRAAKKITYKPKKIKKKKMKVVEPIVRIPNKIDFAKGGSLGKKQK